MSLRILCTLSLLVTATRAAIVDVTPSRLHEALEDVPYALVHIHNGKRDEDLAQLDIDVYVCEQSEQSHPDFPLAQSDLFVVVRGIVAPYVGDKSKDMLVYLANRMPSIYPALKTPVDAPMTLVNGAEQYDQQALDWCAHTPELTCVDAEDGPLRVNGVSWDGEDGDRWLRRQMIPPIVDINDATLFDLGLRSFDTHLFVFSDDVNVKENILPVANRYRDDMITIVGPNDHEKAKTLEVNTPGAVFVRRNTSLVQQYTFDGELTRDNLENFISTI